jgi:PelA/Pel-15E family pectate lyase
LGWARSGERRIALAGSLLAGAACLAAFGCGQEPEARHVPTWTVNDSLFRTGARHWYQARAEERIITALPSRPRHPLSDGRAIADNVLLFQKANGGWPKNYDMRAILTLEQRETVSASASATNTTFDNGATHAQVGFLADAFLRSGDSRYREGCIRGIDFMLSAQGPSGGWPQSFPDAVGYQRYITFNDGAMVGVLTLLLRLAQGDSMFSFVDPARVARARAAVDRGVACILRCQIKRWGVPTGWCQQHDNADFRPRAARSYEPVAIASIETAGIIGFLMQIAQPDEEVVASVVHAAAWLERSMLRGVRVEAVAAPTARYEYHSSSEDRVLVRDPDAPPIWARYYELGSNRPFFCNRDGHIVYSFEQVDRERRTGYAWFTEEPVSALRRYAAWPARFAVVAP